MAKRTELCLWVVVPSEFEYPQVFQGSHHVASERIVGWVVLNRDDFWKGESGSGVGYGRRMCRPHRGAVGRGVKRGSASRNA